ncbi:MAG: aldehyde dehydrogenase (NAD+) [Planctomycetota bacterium]|jgi:aldehyde dehydrogenase (NAD+)
MDVLAQLGIQSENSGAYAGEWLKTNGPLLESRSPGTGELLASVRQATRSDYEACVEASQAAFLKWRDMPAPLRGEVVRKIGNAMRENKEALGALITMEMGKIYQEGLGEVQEAIDIADFAVGQSRMLYGLSMHSERPMHAMREQYHPLGLIGVISAFNFPMAVWAWNSMLGLICGDAVIWKPSEITPLTAIGMTNVCRPVLEEMGLGALISCVIGEPLEIGEAMIQDGRVPLVSFTGSIPTGRHVAQTVAGRLGRSLLELGGNNAVVLLEDADLNIAIPSIVFGSVGTCGQRCTSTRRVLVHESIADEVEAQLLRAYDQVQLGNPMDESTLCGPLINERSLEAMEKSLADAKAAGGTVLRGGERIEMKGKEAGGVYVNPAIVRAENEWDVVQRETFAPILYIIRVKDFDDALAKHNAVPQGLSSSIFTLNIREAERFISASGSDCGIANANIGTSGAEIGGAFGGEKETGGGRESGSDAWKIYMRRQTNTINYSKELPLAQGIKFDVG